MFCKNCGIELDDITAVCPRCGAQAEPDAACEETAAPAQETAAEAVCEADVFTQESSAEDVEITCEENILDSQEQNATDFDFTAQEYAESVQAPAKKSKKLLVTIIAIVVMAALVIAGVVVVPKLFGASYEDVAMNYGLAQAEADLIEASKYCLCDYVEAYDKMVDYSCEEYEMTREEFFEVFSEQFGEKVTDINQLFAAMKEDAITYLQDEYGTYKISARVVGSEEMSYESITELKEYIAEDQGYDYPSMFEGIDADKISAGYTVEVELTIKGSKSTDTESQEIAVVKYDGKWKAIGE
ncbi:MAG: zinc ribbon domain-containing protein [Ruminococcus sp.]|nr:zinc ribbon domain-containing protein [Ruminococcus sp.]